MKRSMFLIPLFLFLFASNSMAWQTWYSQSGIGSKDETGTTYDGYDYGTLYVSAYAEAQGYASGYAKIYLGTANETAVADSDGWDYVTDDDSGYWSATLVTHLLWHIVVTGEHAQSSAYGRVSWTWSPQ